MTYEEMRTQMKNVSPEIHAALVAKCQKNAWLRYGGIPFEDDPCLELDSPYSIWYTESIEALEAYFAHGNWAIRDGIVYHNLAFLNQVNGGDEWWTLKCFDGEWVAFESITFGGIIKRGEFADFLARLERAKRDPCGRVSY